MKEKRAFPWQWCPQPERMKVTRFRPTDKAWIPLVASALILSLLAIQGVQVFTPSAVNAFNPNSYSAVFPTAQPTFQTPSQTPQASQASHQIPFNLLAFLLISPHILSNVLTWVIFAISVKLYSSNNFIIFSFLYCPVSVPCMYTPYIEIVF